MLIKFSRATSVNLSWGPETRVHASSGRIKLISNFKVKFVVCVRSKTQKRHNIVSMQIPVQQFESITMTTNWDWWVGEKWSRAEISRKRPNKRWKKSQITHKYQKMKFLHVLMWHLAELNWIVQYFIHYLFLSCVRCWKNSKTIFKVYASICELNEILIADLNYQRRATDPLT